MRRWWIKTLARALALTGLLGSPLGAIAQERQNFLDDPFVQLTSGLAHCPVPEGPLLTRSQVATEMHYRAERGTSCFMAGRCRLHNAYLYDKEIIDRVGKLVYALAARDPQMAATSLWAEGQRRWVFLKGCVQSEAQSKTLEDAVRNMDDVESVINLLMVGTDGTPGYKVAAPTRK
jgi:BON domain